MRNIESLPMREGQKVRKKLLCIQVPVNTIIRTTAFLVVFCMIFTIMQSALRPKYVFGRDVSPLTSWETEFHEEPADSLDILFLGSSHVYHAVNPILLWHEYGITSYNLGTGAQRLDVSAYLLKRALKAQKPQIVVLEMQSVRYGEASETGMLHNAVDSIPFSIEKLLTVKKLKQEQDALAPLSIPFIKYHERWKGLNKLDFTHLLPQEDTHSLKGCRVFYSSQQGDLSDFYEETSITKLSDRDLGALDDIVSLCKENRIQLVLWNAPANIWRESYSKLVREYADNHHIKFVDTTYFLDDIGIDLAKDFYDLNHLNGYGMEKVTSFLGKYLIENCSITERGKIKQENLADWAYDYQFFLQVKNKQMLKDAKSVEDYLQLLKNDHYTIYMVTNDSAGINVSESVKQGLVQLGLKKAASAPRHSYIAVLDRKKLKYEATDAAEVLEHEEQLHEQRIEMISKGYKAGDDASLLVAGQEQLKRGQRGLGIVTYDHFLGNFVDAVTLDIDHGVNSMNRK